MSVDDEITNRSGNRPFADVLASRFGRRTFVAGSFAAAATTFYGASAASANSTSWWSAASGNGIGFTPSLNPGGPVPTVSADYTYQVLIPWGSPLQHGVPDISETGGRPARAADAENQIGIGHDGMWYFPLERGWGKRGEQGVLCINHEFGRNPHVLGKDAPESLEDVRISQAVHGVSVVKISEHDGVWSHEVGNGFNRRITPNTPVTFDGPAAGHALLDSALGNPTLGTVNNCANGYTPWGSYLTCEENFNGYFGTAGEYTSETEARERYGFTDEGFGYGWHLFDERWDLNVNPGEENRFGWIVEINPWDASSTPVKHTALGRVKHEGFAFATGRDGQAVGYMGDDQRFDYIYKFVSADSWWQMKQEGRSPLSEGALYVARFNDDGTGDWLELTIDNPLLAEAFADQAEVMVYARLAADILGATPMDRPEWTTVAPNGDVYCTLTNNSRREMADAANPQAPNNDGHIIRWRDADQHVGTTFEWDIYLLASTTRGEEWEFTDPDGLWADPYGRVFIQTDGGQPSGNNQMLVSDPATGEIRRLLAGVAGDEITGIAVSAGQKAMFANSQHPGNGDPSETNFPVMNDPADPDGPIPRDATFVITRKDGGVVGS